jgi:hypothetical protein
MENTKKKVVCMTNSPSSFFELENHLIVTKMPRQNQGIDS